MGRSRPEQGPRFSRDRRNDEFEIPGRNEAPMVARVLLSRMWRAVTGDSSRAARLRMSPLSICAIFSRPYKFTNALSAKTGSQSYVADSHSRPAAPFFGQRPNPAILYGTARRLYADGAGFPKRVCKRSCSKASNAGATPTCRL